MSPGTNKEKNYEEKTRIDEWHFQENSMFKQFFGACNQLDWLVFKIRTK